MRKVVKILGIIPRVLEKYRRFAFAFAFAFASLSRSRSLSLSLSFAFASLIIRFRIEAGFPFFPSVLVSIGLILLGFLDYFFSVWAFLLRALEISLFVGSLGFLLFHHTPQRFRQALQIRFSRTVVRSALRCIGAC